MPAASGRHATLSPSAISRTISKTWTRNKSKLGLKDTEAGAVQNAEKPEAMSKGDFTEELVGMLSTVFGLRHVRGTKVGDAAIRGVSGGERKRVSIAEALATRARIGCWDK